MKLFICFVFSTVCLGVFCWPANGQYLEENFSYTVGQLTDLNLGDNVSGGNWVSFSGTGNPIMVSSGSLSYTSYPSSGIGNKIDVIRTTASAEDAYRTFTTQTPGSTIYASFLLNVANTTGLPANTDLVGDYFVALLPSTSTTAFVGRVSIRLGSVASTFQIGLRASTSNTESVWSSANLSLGTTYLIVMKYQLIAGNTNDVVSLWINPALTGIEPAADLTQTSALTTDPANLARFAVRQGTNTPNASIDGIRVGDVWDDVPVPIQLASFTGAIVGTNTVRLDWHTISEVNNYGFYVHRRGESEAEFTEVPNSFVPGHGTTNVPQYYAFTDNVIVTGPLYYRLRQVDLDGTNHFSEPILVAAATNVGDPVANHFRLLQNYPNPFNPGTQIEFSVNSTGYSTLRVYDLLGQPVATIFEGEAEAGRAYKLAFDGSHLSSGTYLYRLQAGKKTEMRKMHLLK